MWLKKDRVSVLRDATGLEYVCIDNSEVEKRGVRLDKNVDEHNMKKLCWA